MNYSKANLSQYLDKIFGVFQGYKVGHGGYFIRTWNNERTPQPYKVHLFDVLNVLVQNDSITYNDDGALPFLKLGQAGFDYMQGAELPLRKLSLCELVDLKKTSDEVFDRIWNFIGKDVEAPFYLGGPDYFNTISSFVGLSSMTYSMYMDERKNQNESTSRIVWYRELFLKLKKDDIPAFLTDLSATIINIYQPLFTSEEDEQLDADIFNISTISAKSEAADVPQKVNSPKVIFISYTWEVNENPGHKEWVKKLADRLKSIGFDVRFDQYQPFGTNMDHFMVTSVNEAVRIILICTPIFKDRSDNMISAAGFEASLISNELIKDITTTKFLPIVRLGEVREAMPLYLGNRNAMIWRAADSDDESFNKLVEDLNKTNN